MMDNLLNSFTGLMDLLGPLRNSLSALIKLKLVAGYSTHFFYHPNVPEIDLQLLNGVEMYNLHNVGH